MLFIPVYFLISAVGVFSVCFRVRRAVDDFIRLFPFSSFTLSQLSEEAEGQKRRAEDIGRVCEILFSVSLLFLAYFPFRSAT